MVYYAINDKIPKHQLCIFPALSRICSARYLAMRPYLFISSTNERSLKVFFFKSNVVVLQALGLQLTFLIFSWELFAGEIKLEGWYDIPGLQL